MTKDALKAWAQGFHAGNADVASAVLRLLAQEEAWNAQFQALKAQEEERQADLAKLRGDGWERVPGGGAPFQCHTCGHQHTGRRLGNICIGCPCEQREAQD